MKLDMAYKSRGKLLLYTKKGHRKIKVKLLNRDKKHLSYLKP